MGCTGWVALQHVETSQTGVPCAGRARSRLGHRRPSRSHIVKKGKASGMLWLEVVGPGKLEAGKLERHGILYHWLGGACGFSFGAGLEWGRKHEDGVFHRPWRSGLVAAEAVVWLSRLVAARPWVRVL